MITDVMLPAMMTSPLHTMADIRELNAGMTESARQLYPELAAFAARAVAREYRIPLFVFQGAADNVIPSQCARAFAETVRAPVTRFAMIPRTGHLAAFTRPEVLGLLKLPSRQILDKDDGGVPERQLTASDGFADVEFPEHSGVRLRLAGDLSEPLVAAHGSG